jgi:hypothetical protein
MGDRVLRAVAGVDDMMIKNNGVLAPASFGSVLHTVREINPDRKYAHVKCLSNNE